MSLGERKQDEPPAPKAGFPGRGRDRCFSRTRPLVAAPVPHLPVRFGARAGAAEPQGNCRTSFRLALGSLGVATASLRPGRGGPL